MLAPDPWDMMMFCEPEVPFSINQSLLTVFGPRVIVQAESKVPVYFKKMDLPGSVAPSAIVVACVSALVVMASVPKANASAINSKFVLVVSPQVPDCSPEPISSNRKSFVYTLAIFLSYAAMSVQDGVCEGVTPVKFDVCEGVTPVKFDVCEGMIIPHGCGMSPISPVPATPVTDIFPAPVIVTEPTEPVPAIPVTDTLESPEVVTDPTEPVPAIPVTDTLESPVTVALFTEAVIVTIVLVVKKLPKADVPATPVTDTLATPTTVTEPTAPVPTTPVTDTFASPVTDEDPTALVPATPVTDTFASAVTVDVPTDPVAPGSATSEFHAPSFHPLVELFHP